jgi:hypothetical protein
MVAAVAASTLFAAPAGAAMPAALPLPPQGIYEQCGPTADAQGVLTGPCVERLDRIAHNGFSVVLNYMLWMAPVPAIRAYLDAAQQRGLRVIVPMNHPAWRGTLDALLTAYPLLGACACTTSEDFTRRAIGLIRDHPAIWGYYIADEARADAIDAVGSLSRLVAAIDPSRPRMVVGLGTDSTLAQGVAPYAQDAEYNGIDYYPVGAGGSPQTAGRIARDLAHVATASHAHTVVVLQAFSWHRYPQYRDSVEQWPTRDEMRTMRDRVLSAARPDLMLWYSVQDLEAAAQPQERWADLQAAAFAPAPRPAWVGDLSAPASMTIGRARTPRNVVVRVTSTVDGTAMVRLTQSGRPVIRRAVRLHAGRNTMRLRVSSTRLRRGPLKVELQVHDVDGAAYRSVARIRVVTPRTPGVARTRR